MIDLSLSDIWRSKHPYDIVFSWHNFDFSIQCRLDRFLISKSLTSSVTYCDFSLCFFSDHDLLLFRLSFVHAHKRAFIWKFNNTLLDDNEYCNQVAALLNLWSKRKLWYDNLHFW
mgnify:CR=1 FL=1